MGMMTRDIATLIAVLLCLVVGLTDANTTATATTPADDYINFDNYHTEAMITNLVQAQCSANLKRSSNHLTKRVYKVGVLGNRDLETLYLEFNTTFDHYLTATAGIKFDPPIRFEIFPLLFGDQGILDTAISGEVDFTFMNPALYSCVESEANAASLLTFINQRTVNGTVYELGQFGGVIFVSKNNTDVHDIADIEGKRVATTSVTSLGSGQLQFQMLQRAGLHHFNSVAQLIIMEDQSRVVDAVIMGEVDVGYVRTDQLERSIDPRTGLPLDLSEVRIVGSQEGALLDTGETFPVALSTPLFPEWNMAAFPHVSNDVMEEVQTSLLTMKHHASLAEPLLLCYQAHNCSNFDPINQPFERSHCEYQCYAELEALVQQRSTDCKVKTSPSIALLAAQAMKDAKCAGWILSKSYMTIRNMQEETGFIETTQTPGSDEVRCMRTTELFDAVVCPPEHFRKTKEEVLSGCETAGLDCYGFQCLCSPCVKAYDVDFFPVSADEQEGLFVHTMGTGCPKFSICGQIIQNKATTFRLVDNKKRRGANFSVDVLVSDEGEQYIMSPTLNANETEMVSRQFTLDGTGLLVGTLIMTVMVDGEQIPQSPFRIKVVAPDCGEYLVASASGECVCPSGTIQFGESQCWKLSLVLPLFVILGLVVVAIITFFYIQHRYRKMDAIWKVDKSELGFDDPPRELGQGTFGVVLLAEYRGTAVAVKRVLPPKPSSGGRASTTGSVVLNSVAVKTVSTDPLEIIEKGQGRLADDIGMRSTAALGSVARVSIGSKGNSKWPFGFSGMSHRSRMRAMKSDFIKEMRTLSKLRHPCIVAIMGAIMERHEVPTLVMEYMQLGALYDLLHNECMVLTGETLLPMLQDIAQGLRFLHSAKPQIVHGDIKSQNILVDARFHAKVADFGITTRGGGKGLVACGTPFWMAPELLRKETTNTAASDVYAFGITLSEMLSRKDPFHGELHLEVLKAVADPNIDKAPALPKDCCPEAKELMLACLRPNPEDRLTAEDIDVRIKTMDPNQFDTGLSNNKVLRKNQNDDDLLSQLFPKHVANALREGRTVEPESHEAVTVYFSDVVGYTEISSTLSPEKVSVLLHRLYSKFDHLCEQFDLFKVETVGDAYMVATLNESNTADNHVALVARFAFDAIDAASKTLIDKEDPSRGYVQIRVGFHSGPVVTHVVGHRNPRYSVIGDVVNIASRMESNSAPGRVTTSKASAELLQQQFPEAVLKSRGLIPIKGKGRMHVYWVERPPAAQ